MKADETVMKGRTMKSLKTLSAFVLCAAFTLGAAVAAHAGGPPPAPVVLGAAGNFVILSKAGISTVPLSDVTGDIGVSPIRATAITGFDLVLDSSTTFSTSPQVTGRVYAADYGVPTPAYLTTAVSNMETAYIDAAGRTATVTELGGGNIGGLTIVPGVYSWSSAVTIPADVTLKGGKNSIWIFQIAGTLDIAPATSVILSGGAQAQNIFWVVAGVVTLFPSSHFEGIILAKTNIRMQAGASINGRLFAQTAVTLISNVVTQPRPSKGKGGHDDDRGGKHDDDRGGKHDGDDRVRGGGGV